jgi:uncharacterized protein (TIGR00290 family)
VEQAKKIYLNWSGGKDSSLCLWEAIRQGIAPDALLTSINSVYDRISMHGVRRELLLQQAAALGLPLYTVELPENPSMPEYEEKMRERVTSLKRQGFSHAMFGDIFLEDLRQYREKQLQLMEISCFFPLWKKDTGELLQQFLDLGFRAIVVCVNEQYLDKSFCGRLIDHSFMHDLPAGVDPCGENGEYHSFVYDGPVFKEAIPFTTGEKRSRQYDRPDAAGESYTFCFCDLIPL